ncbi:hypothetical protein Trco_007738 [Trichoderma cornu-damae]|uniref:Uncharacterized protein n=1 Tax=Trichoderma cornu-damae TaxID=654480 RepID=A0A9P8QKL6_9HYPO|nr:hypothetical protein Trco_007738 [Trichoderma cornu-damae]
MIKRSTFRSAYVWADEIISRSAIDRAVGRDMGASGEDDVQDQDPERPIEPTIRPFRETKWSSDRVRRIIQRHSKQLLGRKLSTSS